MKKRKPNFRLFGCLLLGVFLTACQTETPPPPLDLTIASETPELLAEGLISTDLNERDLTISPDGTELYFTLNNINNSLRAIVRMSLENGEWSQAEVAPFSGRYKDIEPYFSPDGTRLYYASTRPVEGTEEKTDYDLWYVERTAEGWGEPQHLPAPVNTEGNEFYPAIASSGNLYFTTTDSLRNENIFLSEWQNGTYAAPVALDSAINTPTYEFNAYISPDEQVMVFSSYGRSDGFGGGDLYVSSKDETGQWQPAENLGEEINGPFLDFCPLVDWENGILYFSSNRREESEGKNWSYEDIAKHSRGALNTLGNIYRVQLPEMIRSRATND